MAVTSSPLTRFAQAGVSNVTRVYSIWPLSLSKLTLQDAASLMHLMSSHTCQNLGIPRIETLAQAHRFINGVGTHEQQRFAIRHQQFGLLGGVAYSRLSKSSVSDIAEINYWLAEAYRGRGVMHWAVSHLLEQLKAVGVRRVLANVLHHNLASQSLLNQLGFTVSSELERNIVSYQLTLT
ncbi:GNAT family N-acetyltransferase [Pseudoalteromonas sp. SMS1]|uniref:GNAT family N-acetyltransferase n=1 Tax=Pseudoalteromonas sp. SMS1 TaxID=2908894 RepID=UPI001F1D1347|nr:GNAT family N-acetyltransferase [Pseudoalteromonas sp. SMS1]MCF2859240.1 GNAT family N-acetyltransferase [Pseudoalteromonas sp. SMS1]